MNNSNGNAATHDDEVVENVSGPFWDLDVPDENGTDAWVMSTDYADQISEYHAVITGEGPFAWRVSEAAGGVDLAFGESSTLEEAQQDAEAACRYLLEAAHAIPDASCTGAVDGEVWEVSRFGRVLVITETGEDGEIQVCASGEAARTQFGKILAGYLARFTR
ncbi:hypothetical protein [Amycolatopsis lurida]|uniref:hypothetical protein n=1 Tax=Amycolatopsis lurida TaxID=31959 RepID=UPI00365D122B